MNSIHFALGIMLAGALCALPGCGDGGSGTSAGGGGSGASAGSGGAGGGSGGSDAQGACEKVLDDAAARCADRACLYSGWKALCADRPEAVKASFDCLSEDDCQTPADPSAAKTCMEKSYADVASAADVAIGEAYCKQCVGTIDCDGVATPLVLAGMPVTHLAAADNAALQTCLDAATDCNGAETCVVDLLEQAAPALLACK